MLTVVGGVIARTTGTLWAVLRRRSSSTGVTPLWAINFIMIFLYRWKQALGEVEQRVPSKVKCSRSSLRGGSRMSEFLDRFGRPTPINIVAELAKIMRSVICTGLRYYQTTGINYGLETLRRSVYGGKNIPLWPNRHYPFKSTHQDVPNDSSLI